jgi:hypothetical protein
MTVVAVALSSIGRRYGRDCQMIVTRRVVSMPIGWGDPFGKFSADRSRRSESVLKDRSRASPRTHVPAEYEEM